MTTWHKWSGSAVWSRSADVSGGWRRRSGSSTTRRTTPRPSRRITSSSSTTDWCWSRRGACPWTSHGGIACRRCRGPHTASRRSRSRSSMPSTSAMPPGCCMRAPWRRWMRWPPSLGPIPVTLAAPGRAPATPRSSWQTNWRERPSTMPGRSGHTAPTVTRTIEAMEDDAVSGDAAFHTQVALLNKINAAGVLQPPDRGADEPVRRVRRRAAPRRQ